MPRLTGLAARIADAEAWQGEDAADMRIPRVFVTDLCTRCGGCMRAAIADIFDPLMAEYLAALPTQTAAINAGNASRESAL